MFNGSVKLNESLVLVVKSNASVSLFKDKSNLFISKTIRNIIYDLNIGIIIDIDIKNINANNIHTFIRDLTKEEYAEFTSVTKTIYDMLTSFTYNYENIYIDNIFYKNNIVTIILNKRG